MVPKLFVEDHKKNKSGAFPTYLVIPATKYLSCLSEIGYLSLKWVPNDNDIEYLRFTIVNLFDIETNISNKPIMKDQNLQILIDIDNMYPLVELSPIKREKEWFRQIHWQYHQTNGQFTAGTYQIWNIIVGCNLPRQVL